MKANKLTYYTTNKLNANELEIYNTLYSISKFSTPFHNINFLYVINETRTDIILRFFIIKNNLEIIAILPYFDKMFLPIIMNALPYGCYGGFLYNNDYRKLLKDFFLKNKFLKLITVINVYNDDLYDVKYLYPSVHSTWIIECSNSYDDFFINLHSKTRNQIRGTYKNGIKVKSISTIQEVDEVFRIYEELIIKHNIKKPYTKELFIQLFKSSQSDKSIHFKLALLSDKIISYSIFLENNNQIFYWLNSSDRNFLKYNGTNAILDYMIKYSFSKNIKDFNLGAVPLGNDSLHHFKIRWNAKEKKYKSYKSKFYKIVSNII